MAELLLVDAETCRPVRAAVLRPHRPAEENVYPRDDDERTLHVALEERGRIVGVGTMLPDDEGAPGGERWRIRGMAVLPEHRGRGFGRMMLRTLLAVAAKRGGGLWCRARTDVVGFYEREGLVACGEPFEVDGLGPHVVMTWRGEAPPDDEDE